MVYHSSQNAKDYLQAMKQQMSGHFQFGVERYTGFFFRNCFYVTHHAGFEWNRKITNQKNAAERPCRPIWPVSIHPLIGGIYDLYCFGDHR